MIGKIVKGLVVLVVLVVLLIGGTFVAASFHDKSKASPTPLFIPRPPVGITRCTASPARKTRL